MKIEPPRRAPDNEQRLIVLNCLNRLGPCTELQLLQFLFEYDVMNYFDMMIALSDLCARGQAARTQKDAGYQYEVTEAGIEALSLFGGRTPRSVMTLLSETGDQWKARFREEAQARQTIHQTDRGDYELDLAVMERDTELLRLQLTLPTRELAQRAAGKWPRKAAEIYGAVIRLLAEEDE